MCEFLQRAGWAGPPLLQVGAPGCGRSAPTKASSVRTQKEKRAVKKQKATSLNKSLTLKSNPWVVSGSWDFKEWTGRAGNGGTSQREGMVKIINTVALGGCPVSGCLFV